LRLRLWRCPCQWRRRRQRQQVQRSCRALAAAPAGAAGVPEPSDAPGISQEQLRVWWEKLEAKVVTLANDARSLTIARFVAEVDD